MNTFQIVSLNVNGIKNVQKRTAIFTWLKLNYNGVYFLQETHSFPNCESKWKDEWDGDVIFCHGNTNSRGVAILFSKGLDIKVIEKKIDIDGRFLLCKCEIAEQIYIFLNLYAPTKDNLPKQVIFCDEIFSILENYSSESIVIGGDLNTYLNPSIDKKGGQIEKISPFAEKIKQLMEFYDLIDVWRERNSTIERYTWRERGRGGLVQSRLDYFLVSRMLNYSIANANINSSIKTDHSLILLNIKLIKEHPRGKGYWKLNTKFLRDAKYVERISKCINEAKIDSKNIENKHLVWDYIKCRIRGESIKYSKQISKQTRDRENELLNKIDVIETNIGISPCVNKELEYKLLRQELDSIYNEKAKGAIVRSRCQWIEENEKCSKYFLNLERRNYSVKNIKSLLINGETIEKPELILDNQKLYYENLYTEPKILHEIDIINYLNDIAAPKISNESKNLCENELTIEECAKALKDLPNDKAPGFDGIPVDFYKVFWKDIKDILYENYNISKCYGRLTENQRHGIISLIPKPNKDLRELTNWRPLSLLNADYKILTKALSNRLKLTLPEIINPDQIGYMKNRYCGENTRLISDIIEYCQLYKKPGVLLLVDFEKAFDTVRWQFLLRVLDNFNFGCNFISWIKVIYNDIFSSITNNGYFSKTFTITRGIRQGDPISAFLFILVAEIIALLIRNNVKIKGIIIDKCELKLCQLADDTTLFLQDEQSILLALAVFEEFYRYAGLKMNKSKTEAVLLYKESNVKMNNSDINWSNKPFKTLGIWYSLNNIEMNEINVNEKTKNIESLLNLLEFKVSFFNWQSNCFKIINNASCTAHCLSNTS